MMKKVLVIFLFLTFGYVVWNQITDDFWNHSEKKVDSVKVTNGVEQIIIDLGSGDTKIYPEKRDDVRAELEGDGSVSVKKHGSKIEVSFKQKFLNWFNWNNWFHQEKAELILYIPEDYDKDLTVQLGSGDVSFDGESKGNEMKLDHLTIDVGSGNMKIENVHATTLKHDSSSGNIEMEHVTTKSGTFDIRSGNVKIKKYSGSLDVDVSSGDLDIELEKLIDSINVNLSSGNIKLDLPNHADFQLKGEISSGNINCDYPLENKIDKGKEISGTYGNGKYTIDLDVSSGNIDVY